jgi:hypothetical protein
MGQKFTLQDKKDFLGLHKLIGDILMQQICHFLTYLRVSKPALPAMHELALSILPLMGWEQVALQIKLFDYLTKPYTTSMIYNLVDFRRRDEVV